MGIDCCIPFDFISGVVIRKEFYREKFVYSWGAIIFDACLFGFLFIVYAIAGYHRGSFG